MAFEIDLSAERGVKLDHPHPPWLVPSIVNVTRPLRLFFTLGKPKNKTGNIYFKSLKWFFTFSYILVPTASTLPES